MQQLIARPIEWETYVQDWYADVPSIPATPPSYPVIVHSSVHHASDVDFVVHSFITVEMVEMPDADDYVRDAEADLLLSVARAMSLFEEDAYVAE